MAPARPAALLLAGLILALGVPPLADEIRTERVQFATGASSASIKSSLKGRETVDYVLGAAKGQTMSVSMTTSNLAGYFNILQPGSSDEAMFVGSVEGNDFSSVLSDTGDYTIRVYLMRSAARRDETMDYSLSVAITGAATDAVRPGDAKVAGTAFHATGSLPCSRLPDRRGNGQCKFGVVRGDQGSADIHVTSLGGETLVLSVAGSTIQTRNPNNRLTYHKQEDEWAVAINDDYFVVPEEVVFGD